MMTKVNEERSGITVGDAVMLCSVNHKPRKVSVTKVGPKLVHVDGDDVAYRRDDDLHRNDGYRHEWLLTLKDFARRELEQAAEKELRALGVDIRMGGPVKFAPEILAAVRTVLP